MQTWKLKEEGRLLEIVDPEMAEYPKDEVIRYIKVALFCTQAAAHQRPDMKQVVKMLSEDVSLNDQLLTEPGVYRPHSSRRSSGGSGGGRSLQITSTQIKKSKQSENTTSTTLLDSSPDLTEMVPR